MKKHQLDHKLKLNLDRFAFYIKREAALSAAAWGAVAGLGLALALNAAAWMAPIVMRRPRIALSVGIPAAATLIAFLIAYLYPRSPAAVARLSDARLALRNRLATAIEVREGRIAVPAALAALQWQDACETARRADPRQGFAPRFPRRQAQIGAIVLPLLIAALLLPNPQEARIAQRQAEQAAIEQQVARLEKLREAIAADESLSKEDREALLRELDEAIQDLQSGTLSREEAVARLSEVEERLKERLDRDLSAQRAALEQAGREAMQDERTSEVGQALAERDPQGAAQSLEALGEALPSMDEREREATAQQLEAMARSLENTHPDLAQALREAAEATRSGDEEAAQQALQRAAELTRQAGEQLAAQEATERALGQIQEGRRAIAQSGEPQPEQQEPGPPDGSPGEGQTGSGSGEGESTSTQKTPGQPQGQVPPNAPGQEGETPYDPIYVPERLGEGEGEQVQIPGQEQGGTPGRETDRPVQEGQSLIPYDQVYTDYQDQAASALENSYIPRGMKDYVRAYFSSLDPGAETQ